MSPYVDGFTQLFSLSPASLCEKSICSADPLLTFLYAFVSLPYHRPILCWQFTGRRNVKAFFFVKGATTSIGFGLESANGTLPEELLGVMITTRSNHIAKTVQVHPFPSANQTALVHPKPKCRRWDWDSIEFASQLNRKLSQGQARPGL